MADVYIADLQVVEVSPTINPANMTLSLYQKSKHGAGLHGVPGAQITMENDMFKDALELVEKSAAPKDSKEAMKSALASLKKFIDDSPEEQRKCFQKAMGMSDEGEKVAKSAAQIVELKSEIQKSITALDQQTPATTVALDTLSALVGHKPVHRQIDELSPQLKALFESVQKSNSDMAARLAESDKQRAAEQKLARRSEYIQKSATSYKHVPLASEEFADLLEDTNGNEKVFALLDKVQAAMSKSALFTERGTVASGIADKQTKTDLAVAELVQKSAANGTPMTKTAALMAVLKSNPALFADADRAQRDEKRE